MCCWQNGHATTAFGGAELICSQPGNVESDVTGEDGLPFVRKIK
jgi:hypothetical protein